MTLNNFLKVAEERLVIAHPDGAVDEFFEGFFRAFEGNPALMNNLADPQHSIATAPPEQHQGEEFRTLTVNGRAVGI